MNILPWNPNTFKMTSCSAVSGRAFRAKSWHAYDLYIAPGRLQWDNIPPTPLTLGGPSRKPVRRKIAFRCCSFSLFTDAPGERPVKIDSCCWTEASLLCITVLILIMIMIMMLMMTTTTMMMIIMMSFAQFSLCAK